MYSVQLYNLLIKGGSRQHQTHVSQAERGNDERGLPACHSFPLPRFWASFCGKFNNQQHLVRRATIIVEYVCDHLSISLQSLDNISTVMSLIFARTYATIKPHVPMIKFRKGGLNLAAAASSPAASEQNSAPAAAASGVKIRRVYLRAWHVTSRSPGVRVVGGSRQIQEGSHWPKPGGVQDPVSEGHPVSVQHKPLLCWIRKPSQWRLRL